MMCIKKTLFFSFFFIILLTITVNNKAFAASKNDVFKSVTYSNTSKVNSPNKFLNNYTFKQDGTVQSNKGYNSSQVFISPYFNTKINNMKIVNYATPVYVSNLNKMVFHSFSTIKVKKESFKLDVSIDCTKKVTKAVVITSTKRVNATVTNDKTISFSITDFKQYTVLINDDDQRYAYTLFVEPYINENSEIQSYKDKGYQIKKYSSNINLVPENTLLYFEKGLYEIDPIELSSNSVLYLKSGAILIAKHTYDIDSESDYSKWNVEELKTKMGSSKGRNPVIYSTGSNVKILGNGIIDFSKLDHSERAGITCSWGKNIDISRITLINPAMWTITTYKEENVNIDNVKIFGFRMNSDAIILANTQNSTVKKCFARSGDDLFEVKTLGCYENAPSKDIIFNHCVAWNSAARSFGITGETEKNISNIVFKNSSVIYSEATWNPNTISSLAVIKEVGNGNISNIKFKNIKIYHELGRAINISISSEISNTSISNISFNNVKYKSNMKNLIKKGNNTNQIKNVTFE